jgi:hypothetical protein
MNSKCELADQVHRDQVLATRALAAVMLDALPESVHQAVRDGTGQVELRTRIESPGRRSWCSCRSTGQHRCGLLVRRQVRREKLARPMRSCHS